MVARNSTPISSSHQPRAASRVYRLATVACAAASAQTQATASTTTPAMPPHTPSQLLPGLIDGASLLRVNFRPKARPAK